MGKELFEQHSLFKKWMLRLNSIVYDIIGEPIVDVIHDDSKTKSDIFKRTLYIHPEIFTLEYSLAQVLLEIGMKPDYVLGVSKYGKF